MTRDQARSIQQGTVVEYHGRQHRVNGVQVTGIAAPYFRLNIEAEDGTRNADLAKSPLVSHALCARPTRPA